MRAEILGISFDDLTTAEAVQSAGGFLDEPEPRYIVTPNPEIVYISRTDPDLRVALNSADMVLPDGIGVIWASRVLKKTLRERSPGFDFAGGLLELMERRGKKLFILGAKPGVADIAVEKLRLKHPALNICGSHHGYFKDDSEVLPLIKKAAPDVLFVCLGAPRQEKWMLKNKAELGAVLQAGLGGSVDVWAGTAKRAPKVFIKLKLEWLYRIARHPSRLGRAGRLPAFVAAVLKERFFGKKTV